MAFDYSGIIGANGTFSASHIEAFADPSILHFNSDGSVSITGLNSRGSFQDANNGFPGPLTAADPLGIPGTFQSTDIPGYLFTTYSAINHVVEERQYNFDGTVSTIFTGGQVIAYNPGGFLVESIDGYRETGNGTYAGTLNGTLFLVTTDGTSLNTYDAAGNPIASQLTTPQTYEPLSFDFGTTVPEPGIGLLIGLIAVCLLTSRAVFGRGADRVA